MSSEGVLSGIPAAHGTFDFNVRVVDDADPVGKQVGESDEAVADPPVKLDRLVVEPYVAGSYSWLSHEGFRESGGTAVRSVDDAPRRSQTTKTATPAHHADTDRRATELFVLDMARAYQTAVAGRVSQGTAKKEKAALRRLLPSAEGVLRPARIQGV